MNDCRELVDSAIYPDWPAPAGVCALTTTRQHPQGNSLAPYESFNLGLNSGEDLKQVHANRQLLTEQLSSEPMWLQQVHGQCVINAAEYQQNIEADGCFATQVNQVCAVLTADCLPILLCDQQSTVVAAVHAGWRGLYSGVIKQAIARIGVAPESILAWLGPAIGAMNYAVDVDFRERFVQQSSKYAEAFRFEQQWHADLYAIARIQLAQCGVRTVYGGQFCTYANDKQFYSYRRACHTGLAAGRQASLIWLKPIE